MQYGILGTTIYYLWNFTLIVFLFRLDKRIRPYDAPELQTLTFTLKIYFPVSLFVATIGGSWMGLLPVILIGVFRARIEQLEEEEAKAEVIPSSSAESAVPGYMGRPRGSFP